MAWNEIDCTTCGAECPRWHGSPHFCPDVDEFYYRGLGEARRKINLAEREFLLAPAKGTL